MPMFVEAFVIHHGYVRIKPNRIPSLIRSFLQD